MAGSAASNASNRRERFWSTASRVSVSPGEPLQPFWKVDGILGDHDVLQHIKSPDGSTASKTDRHAASASSADSTTWESPPNPLCSASFGDQGTTATVNAYGILMQFGDYLGTGRSGMFTADHEFVEEPFQIVVRAEELDQMTKESSLSHKSYGLSLEGLIMQSDQPPKLSWRHWRWPCYKYGPGQFSDPNTNLTVEWMVHDKTLLQRCTIENTSNQASEVDINFLKHLRIRDLDHTGGYTGSTSNTEPSTFNSKAAVESGPGPGSYSWIWRVQYPPVEAQQDRIEKDQPVYESQLQTHTKENDANSAEQVPTSYKSIASETSSEPVTPEQQTEPRLQYFRQKQTPPPSDETDTNAEASKIPVEGEGPRPEMEPNSPCAVTVVAAVFVNGVAMKFESGQNFSSPQTWSETWQEKNKDSLFPQRRVEIIVAYRMLLLPLTEVDWHNLVIPKTHVRMDDFMGLGSPNSQQLFSINLSDTTSDSLGDNGTMNNGQPGDQASRTTSHGSSRGNGHLHPAEQLSGIPSDSPSNHLRYAICRNLEHILSVCAIPVGTSINHKCDDGIPPVAITCGDMSLHRVCNSASFFALQFLIEIARRLDRVEDPDDGIKSLQSRIRSVCVGHVKWLAAAEKPISNCFAANYWVTGKVYPNDDKSDSWHAVDGPTDTPFQILKVAAILELYDDKPTRTLCESFLRQLRDPWLKYLSLADPRVKFAWPHAVEEGINTFRLDDHVWIWRAFKTLENFKLWEEWPLGTDKKKYSVVDIQKEMLQRFTVQNDELGKRMLAVTRSAREHRFQFHARDTALLYQPARDFFLPSFQELWDSTIQAQAYHEDNGKLVWDNAIRYGLAITMGSHGFRNDTTRDISSLVRDAVRALFQTTSLNGFFPGQLDESADGRLMPVLFDEEQYRDFYFHAHFEICHILLGNFDRVCAIFCGENGNSGDSVIKANDMEPLKQNLESRASENLRLQLSSTRKDLGRYERHASHRPKASMKKTFQYGNLLDSSKIVDIDEEWLFNYPQFFGQSPPKLPDFSGISTWIKQADGAAGGGWISRQMNEYKSGDQTLDDASLFSSRQVAIIFDIPKQKHVGKRNRDQSNLEVHESRSRKEIWNKLAAHRTAERAKKRSIVLANPDAKTAMICYLTCPSAYQEPLAMFLDLYSKQENVCRDRTSMVANTWTTELLLGFYAISTKKAKSKMPDNLGYYRTRFHLDEKNVVVRKCVGFRFDGDIFDRYWTCLVVHSVVKASNVQEFTEERLSERDKGQRKVQELILACNSLKEASHDTRELIQKLEKKLKAGVKSFANLSSKQYLAETHLQLQSFRNLLELMNTNLSMILHVISRWDAREGDRAQQPRWTRNDERKYRESISLHRATFESKILELKDIYADAKALEEKFATTLSTNIARIAEDRSLRESENMRLFTYVTVVFLPLGFASSVFSMSGLPDTPLLVNMITCAIVALVLTVVMLVNAKELASMVQRVSWAIHEYSRDKMKSSAMSRHRDDGSDEESDDEQKRKSRIRDDEKSWFLWFWVKYLLVEIPARRVVVAGRLLLNVDEVIARSADYFGRRFATEDAETQTSIYRESVTTALPFTGWSSLQIFGGLVFSPLFVTSWAIQLLIYNILDILRLVGRMYSILMSSLPTTPEYALPPAWFAPRKWWRPIRRLDDYVRRPKTPTEDEDAKNEDGKSMDTRQYVKRKTNDYR